MIVLNKDRKDQNLNVLFYTHLSMLSTNLDDNWVTCYDRLRQNSMIFQRLTAFSCHCFLQLKRLLNIKQMVLWITHCTFD